MLQKTHKLHLHVQDRVGVLDQISILIRRSGLNISEIHASPQYDGQTTRLLITVQGRGDMRLLLGQLDRLDCILSLAADTCAQGRELALASFDKGAPEEELRQLGAAPLPGQKNTWQLCAAPAAVDAFLALCGAAGARTIRTGEVWL
ncbi:ACT domain-containing protein [Neobittarella massiliensis]|uniref:ACT domain-containing protein n=1 Tax=Neobittarella massiliensis (ex Bilen et al. 2018) TaxID=2041842 RepID=UPI000CF608D9|nr:ACT domain-containing protein [Neobittarella massiliensis]